MNMQDNMVNNVFQMTWEQWLQKFWEQGEQVHAPKGAQKKWPKILGAGRLGTPLSGSHF